MAGSIGLRKRTVWYFLYGVVITLVLLWALLPVEYLRQWLQAYVQGCYPRFTVEIEEAGRRLPAGVVFRAAKIRNRGSAEVKAVINALEIQPELSRLIRMQPAVQYKAELYKGTVAGSGVYDRRSASMKFSGQAKDIRLELTRLEYVFQRLIEGGLNAEYQGRFNTREHVVEAFKASMRIHEGVVGLRQPFLGHSSLPFNSAACLLSGDGIMVRVEQGTVESELFTAEFQGDVEVKHPYVASVVSLNGTISPRPEFFASTEDAQALEQLRTTLQNKEKIEFSITGEVGAPGITFGALSQLLDQVDKG